MNLRQVEVFCAVMRCRTLVAASHELGISQPAVSNAIKHLEAQLGIVLFDRVANRLAPTNDARTLYRDAEPLEAMAQALAARVSDMRTLRRGKLRVLASQAVGRSLLTRAIAQFARRGPDLHVYFDVRRVEGILECLESGFADLGFAVAPAPRPGMAMEPVARGTMVVALPRGHPLTDLECISPPDLSRERMIGLEAPSRIGMMVRKAFDDSGTEYRCDIEVRHCVTACMLVEQGVGVAVVDDFSASSSTNWNLELRRFVPELSLNACALFVKSKPLSRLAKRFLADLREGQAAVPQRVTPAVRPALLPPRLRNEAPQLPGRS